MQPRIVSTKRLATELVEQLDRAGILTEQHDFIQTIIQVPDKIDSNQIQKFVVLTSKSAVNAWLAIAEHFCIKILDHPVFCIDQATKKEVIARNLTVQGEAKDSSSLADVITQDSSIQSMTYVCSGIRRDELSSKLRAKGVEVNEIIGYHTHPTPIKIIEPFQGVLFFSPSGVDSFLSLNEISSVCFCIGDATAAHATSKGFKNVQVAELSTPESVIKKVIHYYSKNPVHA
jgi:uroporphyrinogen-III synthase